MTNPMNYKTQSGLIKALNRNSKKTMSAALAFWFHNAEWVLVNQWGWDAKEVAIWVQDIWRQKHHKIITPDLNPANKICNTCKAIAIENGFNKSGEQMYVCRRHTPSWSYNGSGVVGSEPIGDRAMTPYERVKRCRAKKSRENPPKKRGRPKKVK